LIWKFLGGEGGAGRLDFPYLVISTFIDKNSLELWTVLG